MIRPSIVSAFLGGKGFPGASNHAPTAIGEKPRRRKPDTLAGAGDDNVPRDAHMTFPSNSAGKRGGRFGLVARPRPLIVVPCARV